jgi:hypothetical protein
MRVLILMAAVLLPSSAIADSRCIALEGSTLINRCETCTQVSVRELRPRGEQAVGMFTGESRTVRLEGGARETLQGSGGWAISDLKACP